MMDPQEIKALQYTTNDSSAASVSLMGLSYSYLWLIMELQILQFWSIPES